MSPTIIFYSFDDLVPGRSEYLITPDKKPMTDQGGVTGILILLGSIPIRVPLGREPRQLECCHLPLRIRKPVAYMLVSWTHTHVLALLKHTEIE